MIKDQWLKFRDSLLNLHKNLLEFERKTYEGQHGKIKSPGVMLGLVMENPNFAWLRQISGLIVAVDELLESKEPISPEKYKDMLAYCKKLLTAKEMGTTFEKNYYKAIHNSPSVAIAHAVTQRDLKTITV